jgi:hypothetical protein
VKTRLLKAITDYKRLSRNKDAGVGVYLIHFLPFGFFNFGQKSFIFGGVFDRLGLIINFYVNFLHFAGCPLSAIMDDYDGKHGHYVELCHGLNKAQPEKRQIFNSFQDTGMFTVSAKNHRA